MLYEDVLQQPPQRAEHKVKDLCAEISPMKQYCLDLHVIDRNLYRLPNSNLKMEEFRCGELVTFSNGILRSDAIGELSPKVRVCLAVVLSWSLLDFYDEPWFRGGWTKDTIHMMRYENDMFLRPLLVTEMRPPVASSQPDTQPRVNEGLLFLRHGLLLVEIFRQGPADTNFDHGTRSDHEEAKGKLKKIYRDTTWGNYHKFRQSVKACIDANETDTTTPITDPTNFAQYFCENVIEPLQHHYQQEWGSNDPDVVIADIKIPMLHQPHTEIPGPSSSTKVGMAVQYWQLI